MQFEQFWKQERQVWHAHFMPGIMAGMLVALVAAMFEISGSNIAMFASIGASAVILTHKYKHHLTMLKTVLLSYILAGIVGVILLMINMDPAIRIGFSVVIVTMVLYSVNVFHPPAISAGLAIVLYDRPLFDLLTLVLATIVGFIAIRFFIYVFHEHLSVKDFFEEFI
ncbi:HPP family protein [Nanoarchaeota archaeon]